MAKTHCKYIARLFTLPFLMMATYSSISHARPEYALRNNFVSCTACHHSPVGGGIRNHQGKLFGNHGMKSAKLSEKLDWFQIDVRAEALQAKSASTRKGLMLMTTTPAVALPIEFEEDSQIPPTELVMSYGLGRLDLGLGETFLKFNWARYKELAWIETILAGRFLPPFGVMTDEHRTYTKLATLSTNRDYESGLLISGTPYFSFHYDLALTNGLQGDTPVAGDSPWAVFLNLRTMPWLGPLMFGVSASKHGTQKQNVEPEAAVVYGLFSFDKLTNRFPVTFIGEFVTAHGWNNSAINTGSTGGIGYFIPSADAAWQTALTDSRSQTLFFQANWQINYQWVGQFRAEEFVPDVRYSGDSFYRIGYGFKWFLNGQTSLMARYETAKSTRPGVTEAGSVRAVGDNFLVYFHVWL